jgi:uroporphyrinogen-III synthase
MIARPFDDTILLTGDGLRKLLPISGARQKAFIAALQQSRIITRGPKPARALREIDLTRFLAAQAPTSQGVLETLAAEDLAGRRIGLQLYPGDGAQFLVGALKERGALVDTVTPYRYATEMESGMVAGMIQRLAAGEIQMIAFTATPQLQRLITVAEEYQLERELRDGLARAAIAAIGPVMAEARARHGLEPTISPKSSFHLKPMVKAIGEAWLQMVPA